MQVLSSVVQKCLQECTKLNIESIAIPSIGAGNLNYPDDVVARCLLGEAASYLKMNEGKTTLNLIHFVIFVPRTYQAFQQYLNSLTTASASALATSEDQNFMATIKGEVTFDTDMSTDSTPVVNKGVCSFFLLPSLHLVILQGDIADDDSQVIVNTTNTNFDLSAGAVSLAILRKGGKALQISCDSIKATGVKLSEGKVVVTKAAGDLKCEEVFHILLGTLDDNRFVHIVLNCLQKAEERKHQSIAFPAIGTGNYGFSPAKAAKGIAKALQKFVVKKPRHVHRIRILIFQQQVYQNFTEAFISLKEEEGGSWYNSVLSGVKAGAKAIGSFLSGNASQEDDIEEEFADAKGSSKVQDEEEEWEDVSDSFGPGLDVSVDEHAVVVTVFGETQRAIQQAEKGIEEMVKTQFVTVTLVDLGICELTPYQVNCLEREASLRHVEIEIDQEYALHTVKLHGFNSDVLDMKDKIRQVLSTLKQEQAKGSAALVIQKTIRWVRQLPTGEEEYDVMLNYEIEEAYKQNKKIYTCDSAEEKFTVNFETMEETDTIKGFVVKVKRIDYAEG